MQLKSVKKRNAQQKRRNSLCQARQLTSTRRRPTRRIRNPTTPHHRTVVAEVIAAAIAVVEETEEAEEATFKIEDAQSPEDNHRIIQDHNHKPEVLAIVAEKTVMCPMTVGPKTRNATTVIKLGTSSLCADQHLHLPTQRRLRQSN